MVGKFMVGSKKNHGKSKTAGKWWAKKNHGKSKNGSTKKRRGQNTMAGGLTIYSSVGNISFPWVFYVFWSVITIINIISSHFSHLKNPLSCPPFFPRVRRFSLHTRRVFQ